MKHNKIAFWGFIALGTALILAATRSCAEQQYVEGSEALIVPADTIVGVKLVSPDQLKIGHIYVREVRTGLPTGNTVVILDQEIILTNPDEKKTQEFILITKEPYYDEAGNCWFEYMQVNKDYVYDTPFYYRAWCADVALTPYEDGSWATWVNLRFTSAPAVSKELIELIKIVAFNAN